jgi:hypothetical protein
MDEHIEIHCMMKQDPFYDKDAIHKHGLSGLEDERLYIDMLRYAIMLDNAVFWLKKLEKHEREQAYARSRFTIPRLIHE